jgi:tetratricopeptide (TPR) repeat protein
VKKALLVSLVILLLAAVLLQWGLDRTPVGTGKEETGNFPAASSLLDLFGGARQYLAFTLYIKSDKLHHTYYGSFVQEAELVPYFKLTTLMDPHYVSAYYIGAGIIQVLGKRQEAIDYTLQGIEANPESADLYYSLGDFYLQEERYGEAKEAFEKALMYEPETVSRNIMLTALAAACSAIGDEDGQRKALMDKVLYNQMLLLSEGYTYGQRREMVRLINSAMNAVMAIGQEK